MRLAFLCLLTASLTFLGGCADPPSSCPDGVGEDVIGVMPFVHEDVQDRVTASNATIQIRITPAEGPVWNSTATAALGSCVYFIAPVRGLTSVRAETSTTFGTIHGTTLADFSGGHAFLPVELDVWAATP